MSFSQPTRAASFVDALGMNVHVDGPASAAAIATDMAYLGVTHVRAAAVNPGDPAFQVAAYGTLAGAGLKFDLFSRQPIAGVLASVDALVRAHPGSVVSMEGPNEVNIFPMTYGNLTGGAAAQAYQNALYDAVRADPLLKSTPVLGFTGDPLMPGADDASNGHPYPKDGKQPLAILGDVYRGQPPGKPVYFTEAGYATLPKPGQILGVDNLTQAKLSLNLVMDAAKMGVAGTYLYNLIDDAPDPTGTHPADHFGLFTADGAAKPGALAIHDLTTILADSGSSATTFAPKLLNDTISGLPASGSSLVIEKSSGVYDIVVWAEPRIWNAASGTPMAASPSSVTISFGARFRQVQVFDPLLSANPISAASNTQSVTLSLVDHPLIVQVSNFAAAMAAVVAPSAVIAHTTTPTPTVPLLAKPAH